jgi:hypothetical protein
MEEQGSIGSLGAVEEGEPRWVQLKGVPSNIVRIWQAADFKRYWLPVTSSLFLANRIHTTSIHTSIHTSSCKEMN